MNKKEAGTVCSKNALSGNSGLHTLNRVEAIPSFSGNPGTGDSSEILRIYLQSLQGHTRKTQHRWIPQQLGR